MTAPTSGSVLIDLDAAAGPVALPSAPARRRAGRQQAVLLCLSVVLTAAVAGSAALIPPLHLVATLPPGAYAGFGSTGDEVFRVSADGGVLSAYRTTDGGRLWRATIGADGAGVRVVRFGDTLLVGASDGLTTQGLDARTGQVRWTQPWPLLAVDPASGQALLGDDEGADLRGLDPPTSFAATMVLRVDGRTGRTRWYALSTPEHAVTVQIDPMNLQAARVTSVGFDGLVEVVDPWTGRGLASMPVNDMVIAANVVRPRGSGAGLLVTVSFGEDGEQATAYGLDDRRIRWRVPVGATNPAIFDCGTELCVAEATDVTIIDPATGATRWHADASTVVLVGGSILLADAGNSTLSDPRTGEPRLRLPGWLPLSAGVDGSVVLHQGATLALLYAGAGDPPPYLRILGPAPGQDFFSQCWSGAGWLACAGPGNTVQVWRYRTTRP